MPTTKQPKEPTLIAILKSLTAPQAWSLVLIVVGVLSAAWTAGYKTNDYLGVIAYKDLQAQNAAASVKSDAELRGANDQVKAVQHQIQDEQTAALAKYRLLESKLRDIEAQKTQENKESDSKRVEAEAKFHDLESRLEAAKFRQNFVTDYQRYLLADYKAKEYMGDGLKEEAMRARKILVDEVYNIWKHQIDSPLRGKFIAKGPRSIDSRLIITPPGSSSPESIWILPPEIKEEVLQRQ